MDNKLSLFIIRLTVYSYVFQKKKMSFNHFLNLRFVNYLHEVHYTVFSTPELFWATQTCRSEVLAYTERLLRQDKVTNFNTLKNYLISLRDTDAWKIGAFKFFHTYNKTHPNSISGLSLKNDSLSMERFIDDLHIKPNLSDYYEECGHDPHLALKYSVSKIICDEKRLNWMNTFCNKFSPILDIAADNGIVLSNLIIQLDIIDCAYCMGIINGRQKDELLNICGNRIIRMYSSWGEYLASSLLCGLYDICLSSAEIRYLPREAQNLLDSYYLCCNNRLNDVLTIPGWHDEDLSVLKQALQPLVNHELLDRRWEESNSIESDYISKLTNGFNIFEQKLLPFIEKKNLSLFFRESSRFNEFIPIAGGRDFKLYFKTLHLPLVADECPLLLTKFGLFTNLGFWSFDTFPNPKFTRWSGSLTVDAGMPINKDYGHVTIPFYIKEIDCNINISLPYHYTCNSNFIKKNPPQQAEFLTDEIADLKEFFTGFPDMINRA